MTGILSDPGRIDATANYRRPVEWSSWRDPSNAPFNKPWRAQAADGNGHPYTLPMLCIRTETGWINARTRTPLHVTVIGWKYP